jgi:hypothetical protein
LVVRIAVPGPLERVSPTVGGTYAAAAQDLVFDTLLFPAADGNVRSRIAKRLERLGPSSYRMVLDPAVRFSDGSPVTEGDVARAAAFQGVTVRKDGDGIILEAQARAIEPLLFFSALYRDAVPHALGTGTFRVVEETRDRITLDRVVPRLGKVNRVELVASPTARDALVRVLRGEANGILGLGARLVEFVEGVPGLKVVRALAPHARAVVFNDQRIGTEERRRIQAALPTEEIARFACGGGERTLPRSRTRVAKMSPGRALDVAVPVQDLDGELGALALRRALGERGGSIIRNVMALDELRSRDAMIALVFGWPPSALSMNWASGSGLNWSGYSNPKVDAELARGNFAEAAAEIERDAPMIMLCRRERIAAFDARVRNASLGWWGVLDTLPEWEVEP